MSGSIAPQQRLYVAPFPDLQFSEIEDPGLGRPGPPNRVAPRATPEFPSEGDQGQVLPLLKGNYFLLHSSIDRLAITSVHYRKRIIWLAKMQISYRSRLCALPSQQCLLGAAFRVAPGQTSQLFGTMGARCLGFGYGMALAASNPLADLLWVKATTAIQAVDRTVTLCHLTAGAIAVALVTTASFLPAIFVIPLLVSYQKPATAGPAKP